jgi:PAS domain S-box-containing protein
MNPTEDLLQNEDGNVHINLAIVGGGKACTFFLKYFQEKPFPFLTVNILGVCDIHSEAEGLRLAQNMGIYTTNDFRDLLKIKKLDCVLELTADREVLQDLVRHRPKGVDILGHNISRLLRTLFMAGDRLRSAQQQVAIEKGISQFLIEQANERIVVLEPDFTIIEANKAYCDAVGQSRDEVIGGHCYKVTHGLTAPCSSSHPGVGCPLVETLRTGESAHVIHEHPAADGNAQYCDMVTYPLKDQNGEIEGVIEVWRDITEELSTRWERRVNEMKEDMKKLIQEDRMISLGKLVASSVHEINNPIQGLLTFSRLMETMLDTSEPTPQDLEEFRNYLSLMSGELERCGDIISGLLSFSRQSEMEFKNVDLNEILEQVISLTRHKLEIQGIELSTKLSATPLVVNAGVNQLQQCFLNLIFNAAEAMPQGGRLTLISELDRPANSVKCRIQDTGHGIADEHLDHIFDPFYTTKEEGKGTGLGLSIVYGVVRRHEGRIEVNSEEGKGTAFILSFPLSNTP